MYIYIYIYTLYIYKVAIISGKMNGKPPCSCRRCAMDFPIAEVSYGAAISACENRMAWEPALALLVDAKEDLEILMLGRTAWFLSAGDLEVLPGLVISYVTIWKINENHHAMNGKISTI